MITIFSIPKPFTGHIGIIQKNAIQSWLAIKPEPQIILFGNETGTDQICKEFNLLHIPEIEQNELGTPKVHSAFNKVSQAALHPLMAYINADIIVTGEIKDILGSVQGRFKEFLMVGRRVDLDVDELLDFSGMGWKQRLLDKADREGILHWSKGSDYFIFNRSVEWKMLAVFAANIASIMTQNGMPKEAVAWLLPLQEVLKEDVEVKTNLGNAYLMTGDQNQAMQWWLKAVEHNYRDDKAHFSLAQAYNRTKDYQKAIHHYDQALLLGHEVDFPLLRALEWHREDSYYSNDSDNGKSQNKKGHEEHEHR